MSNIALTKKISTILRIVAEVYFKPLKSIFNASSVNGITIVENPYIIEIFFS
ncbi:hypothetical protein AsAng_0060340 [Aureispira anguillae]|uniref:Uncharacterized protein n=1 Tax=Aureispira anguillae TaxID=2864201 RepID=A0A916DX02_9BACT|nr:hypothetical protein AsAng_0060340 [Aureispira anguillae]